MGIVTLARLNGVARIAIERPDKRNAMSPETRTALIGAVESALADAAVHVILLGSNGGHFCAGGDLDTMTGLGPAEARRRMQETHRLVRLLHDSEKPVVAAVEGYAVGAGAGLAMLADCVVIAEGGIIGFPFFRIGLVPDCGLLHTLPRRVGPARARDLLMFGRNVAAAEAVAMGLADALAATGEAETAALERARALAALPPHAFGLAKRQLALFPDSLESALEREAMAQALCFLGDELAEGIAAFKAKRPPDFRDGNA